MKDAMLKFELTEAEANTILGALGNAPFAQVYQIVAKIQSQAQAQMQKPADEKDAPAE